MNNWSQVVCRTAVTLCVGAAAEAWWKRPLIDTEHRDGKTSHRVGWISIYSQTDVTLLNCILCYNCTLLAFILMLGC